MASENPKSKIRIMWITLSLSVILMAIKFLAYFITNSNAVLSDALESIINVVAGIFALYSVYFASKPRDINHPYGHGKIENLSAGFEGALIFIAGASIIIKAVYDFFIPYEIASLDAGLLLCAFAGGCNFLIGNFLIKKGKKHDSMLMVADGKHLVSDTVSSIGLVVGLAVIYISGIYWIDNILAIIFGAVIFRTGYKLIKESLTGLLDEADTDKLNQIIRVFNENRREQWIDIHNLRVLKHGALLHIDCHLTLPRYITLEEAHNEIDELEKLVRKDLGEDVEFFIHPEPCEPSACKLCSATPCTKRNHKFEQKVNWTPENILPDQNHTIRN